MPPDAHKERSDKETMVMVHERPNLIPYALEAVARPGSRETRVKKPPQGARIRNERGEGNGQ